MISAPNINSLTVSMFPFLPFPFPLPSHCSCEYLASKFEKERLDNQTNDNKDGSCSSPSTNALDGAVCLCDDDNDLEMALACSHAYLPSIGSESMQRTVDANPDKITKAFDDDTKGTNATERALDLVFVRLERQ